MASLIEQPNRQNDFEKEMQVHKKIRAGIVILVIGVFIMAMTMIQGNNENELKMNFKYVDCTLEELDNGTILINLNSSNVYNIKVIGYIDDTTVEISNNSIIGESSVKFNIQTMKDDHMEIYIEIENLTLEIREKQKYPMGE